MPLTSAEYDALKGVLNPIRAGRTTIIRRKLTSLGDADFVDGLLWEVEKLDLSALEINDSIVIFQPGAIRWRVNPQTISAIAA